MAGGTMRRAAGIRLRAARRAGALEVAGPLVLGTWSREPVVYVMVTPPDFERQATLAHAEGRWLT
jgi:hypothetical protein